MDQTIVKPIAFILVAIAFALLSLGHKTRLGHEGCMNIHSVMSITYEICASVSLIKAALLFR